MKFALLCFLTILYLDIKAQQVIERIWMVDRIDGCNSYDKLTVKYKKYNKREVVESYKSKSKNSNKEIYISNYDTSGRLTSLKKYDNADAKTYSYFVKFTKIYDSVFESLLRYDARSKDIPTIFSEQLKGKSKDANQFYFVRDSSGGIVIRSVFTLFKDGRIYEIKRFNSNNDLVQVWYPFGKYRPKEEKSQTVLDYKGISVSQAQLAYDDYRIKIKTEVLKDRLLSKEILNEKYMDSTRSVALESYFFDDNKNCILKIEYDEEHELESMKRFIYKDSMLVRCEYYESNSSLPSMIWEYDRKNGDVEYYEDRRDKRQIISERYTNIESKFESVWFSYINKTLSIKSTIKYY